MTLHQLLVLDNYTAAFDADGLLKAKFETNCVAMENLGYIRAQYQIINDEPLGQQARPITVA